MRPRQCGERERLAAGVLEGEVGQLQRALGNVNGGDLATRQRGQFLGQFDRRPAGRDRRPHCASGSQSRIPRPARRPRRRRRPARTMARPSFGGAGRRTFGHDRRNLGRLSVMSNKMWGGRFASGPGAIMEEINASIDFDRHLYRQDIAASKAHADMLAKQGIITADDAKKIAHGLDTILSEIEAGKFSFQAGARRHPHERGGPARRADRARRPGGCTPRARATTRWRPISGCGCATPSTRSTRRSPPISARSPRRRSRMPAP